MEAPVRQKPVKLLRVVQGVSFLALVLFAVHGGFGIGGRGLDSFFNDWVYDGLLVVSAASCAARAVLVREQRAAWAVLAGGLTLWTAGEIYTTVVLSHMDNPPYPSLSDGLQLAFYPASYVALLMVFRARMQQARASFWLDGLVAALAVCTIGEVTVFHTVVAGSGGTETSLQVATDLAYPVGDMVMMALVASVFALTAWRPGRAWAMIALGLGFAAVADSIFAYQSAGGTYEVGTALDALWPAAALLVGFAAWERSGSSSEIRLEGWRILILPVVFALPALGFLVYDHYAHLDGAAVILAGLTLVAVIVRTAMTFGENMRMLRNSRREALTDPLTGLGNRRRLMLDLEREFEHTEHPAPRALALLDLDGFKRYNDSFGHPAGDALLARLGRNLDDAVSPSGRAYRLGGDEFCALVSTDLEGAEAIVTAATDALSEHGRGFVISASHGLVHLPTEASDSSTAMQIADQRLYANKGARQLNAVSQQARDVLMQILQERQPDLHTHLHDVAALALPVGRTMGLSAERLEDMARAAELHDVGKMAIPDEILNKPGPLDGVELGFIRQHTLVGERILAAAPALAPVAKLVRASHENWDGSGYPDGLAGEEIPLESRIIAVCDAYHAMTSDRPYKSAMSPPDAMSELRRCAGTHFDPRVVEILCHEVGPDALSSDAKEPIAFDLPTIVPTGDSLGARRA